jgi:uncharacterized membrane protein
MAYYQIPDIVILRVPIADGCACTSMLGEVCFLEATFQAGLCFLIYPYTSKLLDCLAPSQLAFNAWMCDYMMSCE